MTTHMDECNCPLEHMQYLTDGGTKHYADCPLFDSSTWEENKRLWLLDHTDEEIGAYFDGIEIADEVARNEDYGKTS